MISSLMMISRFKTTNPTSRTYGRRPLILIPMRRPLRSVIRPCTLRHFRSPAAACSQDSCVARSPRLSKPKDQFPPKMAQTNEMSSSHQYHHIEDVEDLDSYGPGGLHPVQIGETFNDRYRILHKLGYGGYSTTWLARDNVSKRLVAIKVARADADKAEASIWRRLNHCEFKQPDSERLIVHLLDDFVHQGPNGEHRCYVAEAAADSLRETKGGGYGDVFPLEVARAFAAQAVYAVKKMHSQGMVHGDLHLGNFLYRLPPHVHNLTDEELYEQYSHPEFEPVVRFDGKALGPGVPDKICDSIDLSTYCKEIQLNDAHLLLTDFGTSFVPARETRLHSRAPVSVRPPEDWFEPKEPISFSSDIWSLGCTLFDIFGFAGPFHPFFPSMDNALWVIVSALGPLPQKWWEQWDGRSRYFKEDGTPKSSRDSRTIEQLFEKLNQESRKSQGWPLISLEERDAFFAMILPMWSYLPKDRPTIEKIIESDWMQRWGIPEYEKLKRNINIKSGV